MHSALRLAALLPLTLLFVAAPAGAEDAPKDKPHTEMVKYRQIEMGAIARHFGAVKRIAKGEVDRPGDLLGHTAALVDLSKEMVSQYPEGSGPDGYKTDALKKIWTDADGFAKAAADFEKATAELHATAEKRDMAATLEAFGKVGDTCGGCHDGFRKDDD